MISKKWLWTGQGSVLDGAGIQERRGGTTMCRRMPWCSPSCITAIVHISTLMAGSGLTTNLADPAGHSGVWEAIETINGHSAYFRLHVGLLTDGMDPDGTFHVRHMSVRLLAAGMSETPFIPWSGTTFLGWLQPKCDLEGETSELVGDRLTGSCRGSHNQLRFIGTFDVKGEIGVLLTGDDVAIPIQFRWIPIDGRSILAGDWYGSSDLAPRKSVLHFRSGFDGALILTVDSWSRENGAWGWEMAVGQSDDNTVLFHRASIEQSSFYGSLSPDKRQISGQYSGGQFASDKFTRIGFGFLRHED
jgi:hypothetical protein